MTELELDGRSISVCIERKKVKNINIRIKTDGIVYVSAGRHVSQKYILELLRERSGFILSALDKVAVRQSEDDGLPVLFAFLGQKYPIEAVEAAAGHAELSGGVLRLFLPDTQDSESRLRLIRQWQTEQCKVLFERINREVCEDFRSRGYTVPLSMVRIKLMKTRWGSCSVHGGRLSMNLRLCEYPVECIYAVFYHEYTHYLHPDHSKAFYNTLYNICPDYEKHNRLLRGRE